MSESDSVIKNKIKEICSNCGQPVAEAKRAGTITGWLLGDEFKTLTEKWHCQCGKNAYVNAQLNANQDANQDANQSADLKLFLDSDPDSDSDSDLNAGASGAAADANSLSRANKANDGLEQGTKFGLAGSSNPASPILPSRISTREMQKPQLEPSAEKVLGTNPKSSNGKAMQSFAVPSSQKKLVVRDADAVYNSDSSSSPAQHPLAARQQIIHPAQPPSDQKSHGLQPKVQQQIPDVVGGKWRIAAPLGTGQLCKTFTALAIEDNKEVVVKIMDAAVAANPRIGKRFLQECEKAAALHHKNILNILDFGRLPDGTPYAVSEHGDHSLAQTIEKEGFLDVPDALKMFDEICSGLIEAHKNQVLHRGIKPENIIISNTNVPKLSDLGVAKALPSAGRETQDLTATSFVFNDPIYMPPEQCQGQQIDERSDVYALGCVLYHALTGKTPFGSKKGIQLALAHLCDPPRSFDKAMYNCDIPGDVETVVMRCLDKNPKRRYQSIAELQQDLRQLLKTDKPKIAKTKPVPKYTPDFRYRSPVNKRALFLIMGALFLLVSVVFLLPIVDNMKPSFNYSAVSPVPGSYYPRAETRIDQENSSQNYAQPDPEELAPVHLQGQPVQKPEAFFNVPQLFLYPRLVARSLTPAQQARFDGQKGNIESMRLPAGQRITLLKNLEDEYPQGETSQELKDRLERLIRESHGQGAADPGTLARLVEAAYDANDDGLAKATANKLADIYKSWKKSDSSEIQVAMLIASGLYIQNSDFKSAEHLLSMTKVWLTQQNNFTSAQVNVICSYVRNHLGLQAVTNSNLAADVEALGSYSSPEQILFKAKMEYAYAYMLETAGSRDSALKHYSKSCALMEKIPELKGHNYEFYKATIFSRNAMLGTDLDAR